MLSATSGHQEIGGLPALLVEAAICRLEHIVFWLAEAAISARLAAAGLSKRAGLIVYLLACNLPPRVPADEPQVSLLVATTCCARPADYCDPAGALAAGCSGRII